ncbi:hypothetical protein FOQG_19525 [Fusarium oxysporum f. sp. raphani 54005]|uniref:Uncharacterized protein n=1 Tax=Fusarium oxysporum f. sp. raphani 54005 TaxID=1089458 RepID=X0BB67_FUSOX|nr:hypothetical protein FOQG_19525 [Fusarium oxysporum f. sp. raphani 54005]
MKLSMITLLAITSGIMAAPAAEPGAPGKYGDSGSPNDAYGKDIYPYNHYRSEGSRGSQESQES